MESGPAVRSTDAKAAQEPKKDPPKPHRDAALTSKDEGKFFSEEAFKQVQGLVK